MRAILAIPIMLTVGGCLHLDAKPMTFTCGSLLAGHVETYSPTPLFAELQRDAGEDDPDDSEALTGSHVDEAVAFDAASGSIVKALTAAEKSRQAMTAHANHGLQEAAPTVLMLSGGGSWGAFGAGFLEAHGRTDWDVVTGISTGALQGLLVAAGDYDRMVREYSIDKEADLAVPNGLIGAIRKGSEYDIAPLRRTVMAYLGENGDRGTPLERIARGDGPELFVGMVEARTGDLKVVAVSALVRSVFAGAAPPDKEKVDRLAECVAGLTIASSSIPARLTPVQIDQRTYMDGGVRSSVFDAGVARQVAAFHKGAPGRLAPEIYIIRNGPTVVFRDKIDSKTKRAKVDARPDLARVGMRGYSTIVNQSELMSIASLRLIYAAAPIRVMTADGFNSRSNPEACGRRPEAVFEPQFMKCLIKWGRHKAKPTPNWIELRNVGPVAAR